MEDSVNEQVVTRVFEDDLPVFNYKKFTGRLIANWYWFIICLLLGLGTAWLYNRYTTPVYAVKSSMLIREESSNAFLSQNRGISGHIFEGFGSGRHGVYNQMVILKSKPLITRAINDLNMEVSYFAEEKFLSSEIYTDAPFTVLWDREHPQLIIISFRLFVYPDRKMELTAEGKNVSAYNYELEKFVDFYPEVNISENSESGVKISLPGYFSFIVFLDDDYMPAEKSHYSFRFNTIQDKVIGYRSRLTIELLDLVSSIVDL